MSSRALQYNRQNRRVPGVAHGVLWKKFLFCVLLALFTWKPGHFLYELVVSGSHLPPCIATLNGSCCTNFVRFLRERGLRVPAAVRTWNSWNDFYEQYLAVTECVRTSFPRAVVWRWEWRLAVVKGRFRRFYANLRAPPRS